MIALFWLARPALVPYLLLLPFFGFAWGHWDRALMLQGGKGFLWVCLAWVLLHSGTLWLNAALDRDEGEVLLGRAVPVPAMATPAAYVALLLCVPVAFLAGPTSGAAAGVCAGLAVLYSHPRVAWKGHPVFGPFVNLVGYGLLSPLAGWAAVGVPTNPRTVVVWLLFGVGILAPYLAAQAFQEDEDRERGYRTAVVVLGPSRTLGLARWAMGVVMLGGFFLAVAGWFPRVCLVALPLWWWIDALLRAWSRLPDGGSPRWAVRYAGRVLVSAGIMVGVCFVEYSLASLAHRPVAGLGTVAGHPPDRPLLAPGRMRLWELKNAGVIGEP